MMIHCVTDMAGIAMNKKYVEGTEPSRPVENPQKATEQANTGISGTTHGGKRTTLERARAHVESIKGLLK
jgi:hypothetical protein